MRYLILAGITTLAIAPLTSAAYTWRPLLLTEDTNSTVPWGPVNINPSNKNIIWVGRANFPDPMLSEPPDGDGLWGSSDGGANWQRVNSGVFLDTYNVLDFEFAPSNPSIAYAATQVGGLFKTTDGGATWAAANGNLSHKGDVFPNVVWGATTVAVDPTNANKVYLGVGQMAGLDVFNPAPDHPGFYYSTDGGVTWTQNNDGLPPTEDGIGDQISDTAALQSIVVSGADPSVIYVAPARIQLNLKILFGTTAEAPVEVYRNSNSGAGTWTNLSNGLPTVTQAKVLLDSLTRIAVGGGFLTAWNAGAQQVLFLGTFGQGIDQALTSDQTKAKSSGMYALPPGSSNWIARNRGLPVVDDDNNKNSINVSEVVVLPSDPYTVLTGVSDSESARVNGSQVWATRSAGDPWLPNWGQSGLDESPGGGAYDVCDPSYLSFSSAGNKLVVTVSWDDGTGLDFTPKDGVYGIP